MPDEPQTVYIANVYFGSDDRDLGVFSTEEKAQAFLDRCQKANTGSYWHLYRWMVVPTVVDKDDYAAQGWKLTDLYRSAENNP